MTQDQILLFSLFGGVFALLLWGRVRYDMVAFGALLLGIVLGVVPADQAFAGFGHPAVIVVALVLIISAGLVRSGAVLLITRTLIDASRSLGAHIAIMGGVGGVLSAFMNNVAALALLMPVDIATARKAGRSPGLSLMPLSFATILGGMVTLIGTPPNIIIATFREDALGEPFAMFDFAPVGGVAAVAGLVFVALVGWRLIPVRDSGVGGDRVAELKPYIAELRLPEDGKLAGKRLRELEDEAAKADVALIGIVRDGRRRYGTGRTLKLAAGDVLVIEADPAALDEFRAAQGLETPDNGSGAEAVGDGVSLVEMVVPEGARIDGRTVEAVGLSWRQNTTLLGIARQGERITKALRKTVIRPGDILLLLAPSDRSDDVVAWLGGMTLADRGLSVTQEGKTWGAIALFAAAVTAAALGLIYLPVALGIVAVGFVAMRVVPLSELYDRIEWPVVVLLGSMIPLGAALETSGGTGLIAEALVALTGDWPAWAILTVLMVVTMTLSDILNNTATAIVAAPVAITMAERLDVNPDPFLMAVAVAASAAFLTPIGHKNNTLVLGPGGYRFGDYWRMGLPLEILIIAVSVPALLVFWPF
ncbi:SLC13 family permease [Roseibacterium sp. SDUM158016]|uniref:SLC13 family permease n=1 Tax=Roseicyclus sediminis TaxID=2980997 RepID=UPI0021D30343|nr:SLC13 family permease [Roseibacterium sp. SDUM158016]MCU4653122.1 SLC13 family permease [Roseibacterium sp. SDUM158016]